VDWYYENDGVQVGPLTDDEFRRTVLGGKVTSSTRVWNETLRGWTLYGDLQGGSTGAEGRLAAICSQCGRQFHEDDMLRYQNAWICGECKPVFFQRLKEAGSVPGTYEYGGFWIRFVAKFVDGIILGAVYGVFVIAFMTLTVVLAKDRTLLNLTTIALWLIEMTIAIGYSIYFVGKYGATPGKMVTGLKIIMADGEPLNYGRATGRFFAEMVSAFACYIGYIMAGFDEEKRSLHDRICNTRVVRK
jgi:uncharacterized RDD family membrane protein YckC